MSFDIPRREPEIPPEPEIHYFERRHLIAFGLIIFLVIIGTYWTKIVQQFVEDYIWHEFKPTLFHNFIVAIVLSLFFIWIIEYVHIAPIISF